MFEFDEILPFALPFALVALGVFFKLVVGQTVTLDAVVRVLFEFPVDILFLAISFLVASAMIEPKDLAIELISLLSGIIPVMIGILVWRHSNNLYSNNKFVFAFLFTFFNLFVSFAFLIWSILVLTQETNL